MRIKSLEKKETKNNVITGCATVELTLDEIVIVSNALYEYTKNYNVDLKKNEVFRTLHRNLGAIRDILKYGIIDGFTWEKMAEDLGYTKEHSEEK